MNFNPRKILEQIYWAAVKAVIPYDTVKEALQGIWEKRWHKRPVYIIAFGKAACPMVLAAEDFIGVDKISQGIAITKYGHIPQRLPEKTEVFEAAHPVPDLNGLKATRKVLEMARSATQDCLCLCLISGGGSALLVSPAPGLDLEDKQSTTALLLKRGADIFELNTVRKHLSAVKGGRLAEALYPAKVHSLILSDVLGDRVDVIASGPTAPDPTSYYDAYRVLEKYDLLDKAPPEVLRHIRDGLKGKIPDTPDEESPVFEKTQNHIIGNIHRAIMAAKTEAEKLDFRTEIITESLNGEAREAAKMLARKAKDTVGTCILISGGETTVNVRGSGKGGRNMELALAFALEIEDTQGITLLSAGTDGTDGPTDAAGAVVNSETCKMARKMGLVPEAYLQNNDSYNFFLQTGELFITGPTGTNVMDLQLILVQ